MKIYPDSELPDIELEWLVSDCRDNAMVSISIDGVDDPAVHRELAVACGDAAVKIEDVARQRYTLTGAMLDDTGMERGHSEQEIDVRNGFDEHAYLYFGPEMTFRVAWAFEAGATCGSLGVDSVAIGFLIDDDPVFTSQAPCIFGSTAGSAPFGVFDVIARGYGSDNEVIAAAPLVPDVMIDIDAVTDLGTLVLAPCAPSCP